MQAILQGKGLGNDIGQLTMEDSKFLGGDLEHTHLVKGLDYALLQKVRIAIARGRWFFQLQKLPVNKKEAS